MDAFEASERGRGFKARSITFEREGRDRVEANRGTGGNFNESPSEG